MSTIRTSETTVITVIMDKRLVFMPDSAVSATIGHRIELRNAGICKTKSARFPDLFTEMFTDPAISRALVRCAIRDESSVSSDPCSLRCVGLVLTVRGTRERACGRQLARVRSLPQMSSSAAAPWVEALANVEAARPRESHEHGRSVPT